MLALIDDASDVSSLPHFNGTVKREQRPVDNLQERVSDSARLNTCENHRRGKAKRRIRRR